MVGVGKTRIELPYNEYFRKELEYRFSRSYGPGRYDPSYEERGVDYPIGYVRWTERRNMDAFLDLVVAAKSPPRSARSQPSFHLDRRNRFTGISQTESSPALEFCLNIRSALNQSRPLSQPSVDTEDGSKLNGTIRIGVIGAGSYASSMLLPHLAKRSDVKLVEVATSTALSAANAARKFDFERTSTDYQKLMREEDVDAVIIATRHASHAAMAYARPCARKGGVCRKAAGH